MKSEERLKCFAEDLRQENLRHNLVSRQATAGDISRHIEDSLAVTKFAELSGLRIIDIGSGGGFPGLVLAIALPEALFTLLESDQKKGAFLDQEIERLGLENCRLVNMRAEEAARRDEMRECFDACTARAVSELRILLEYALPLLKVGGRSYFWKGSRWAEELELAGEALEILGGKTIAAHEYIWSNGVPRMLLEIGKCRPVPDKYPRRAGIPAKRPL